MLKIYLTGAISIERDGDLFDERRFNGRQARTVFAFLVAERNRPVSRDELVEELWLAYPPRTCDRTLNAIVSRLRSLMRDFGMPGSDISARFGAYQMHLPPDTWIDIDAASEGIDHAERALRENDFRTAFGWCAVPYYVAGRPFLIGSDGPWANRRRTRLQEVFLRATDSLAECWLQNGEPSHAIMCALEAVALEPYRESSYRLLMRAHAAGGNRGAALQAYERCRALLSDELGVSPTAQTEALYLDILRT